LHRDPGRNAPGDGPQRLPADLHVLDPHLLGGVRRRWVTGVIMPFQIGTNWSRYADTAGNVLGPLFAYEALTAFFLEAAFLGVLLFGRKLVPPWAHFVAALMIASGTLFSSFWILSANSWMQTPGGYEIVDGRFFPKDWFAIVFNPSFPFRLT